MCSTSIKLSSGKFLFFALILLPWCENTVAQVVQSNRQEIIFPPSDNAHYEVAPAGNRGIFLFRKMISPTSDYVELHFMDTTLQKKWHGFIQIERDYVVTNRRVFFITHYINIHNQKIKKKHY
jgi:hypothetical protein